MNELPIELIIEIFEKIDLKEILELSKTNKLFNDIYKRYFEEKVKRRFEEEKRIKIIPLQFLFNKPGLALPLIVVQYLKIKINI